MKLAPELLIGRTTTRLQLVSLNRLSPGCVTSPRRPSGDFTGECYPCGLSNTATSWILVNPVVIIQHYLIAIRVCYPCGAGVLSTKFKVTIGRQGGILSPYLFNVYVDELREKL